MAPAREQGGMALTIIGGYLGAGKTTLVNHLLREAGGLRLAVLVNEFGALPIDSDLIEGRDGNVLSIAGGCVCCSYGNDLVLTLQELAAGGWNVPSRPAGGERRRYSQCDRCDRLAACGL